MNRHALIFPLVLLAGSLSAQSNVRLTFSIRGFRHESESIPREARVAGHCGKTIVAPPGSEYDDGTDGWPYYTEWREFPDGVTRYIARQQQGFTWEVVLTRADNPERSGVTYFWQFALGVEGPLRIHDFTKDGTASCAYCEHLSPNQDCRPFDECRAHLHSDTKLIDPSVGDQIDPNVALFSTVILSDAAPLPREGTDPLLKLRMFGTFPENEGELATGRVYFTTWVSPRTGVHGDPQVRVSGQGQITLKRGDPPLEVQECEYTLKASSFASYIRCDANADGGLDIADAVWMLTELFVGSVITRCPPAADCNGDWERDISDAVYALGYLFLDGPEPPEPFPDCRIEGPVEDCPSSEASVCR